MVSPLRLILATALCALMLHAAVALLHVDVDWGVPTGPERLLQAIDATPALQRGDAANATAILRDRLIDGRAYRVLAQDADAGGDHGRADALYAIAVRRAPRDRSARGALIDRAFAAGNVGDALMHTDALLRTAPLLAEPMLHALLPLMRDPRVRQALVARLASDPPWRGALRPVLLADTTSPEVGLPLLSQLAQHTPLTAEETNARIALLQRSGQDAQARRLWLATLPAQVRGDDALLFDGGFEHFDTTGPYAWRLQQPPGVSAGDDTGNPVQGTHALAITFGDRAIVGFDLTQSLVLPPGPFRLQLAYDNATDSRRPLTWRIACGAGGAPLVQVAMPASGRRGWTETSADFAVPAGCDTQTLSLQQDGRSLSEQQFGGTLRLDALQIQRR